MHGPCADVTILCTTLTQFHERYPDPFQGHRGLNLHDKAHRTIILLALDCRTPHASPQTWQRQNPLQSQTTLRMKAIQTRDEEEAFAWLCRWPVQLTRRSNRRKITVSELTRRLDDISATAVYAYPYMDSVSTILVNSEPRRHYFSKANLFFHRVHRPRIMSHFFRKTPIPSKSSVGHHRSLQEGLQGTVEALLKSPLRSHTLSLHQE